MRERRLWRWATRVGAAGAALVWPLSALAEAGASGAAAGVSAGAGPTAPPRIEVTGSALRIVREGALPLTTLSRDDIARSGAQTLAELLQRLPSMQGFTAAADSVGGSGGGMSTLSLHGVGEQYTLVLLNGRRLAPLDSGNTVSIETLALSAVERIEVLADGASAVYGADAMAGVVNIILRRGEAPLQLDVGGAAPEHGGAKSSRVALSAGHGDVERDGYSLNWGFSASRSAALMAAQRDFARSGFFSFSDSQSRQLNVFNGSDVASPANAYVYGDGVWTGFNPYLETQGDCGGSSRAADGLCWHDWPADSMLEPERRHLGVNLRLDARLGAGWRAHVDALLNDSQMRTAIAPYPYIGALDLNSPLVARHLQPHAGVTLPGTIEAVDVQWRLGELGPRRVDYQTRMLHLVGGVEGEVAGWALDAALGWSANRWNERYRSGYVRVEALQAALDDGSLDPFAYPSGQMPADMRQRLQDLSWRGQANRNDISLLSAELRASRSLGGWTLRGGPAQLALGSDWRRLRYQQRPSAALADDLLGTGTTLPYDFRRDAVGLFGELQLPLARDLELSAALRHDLVGSVHDGLSGRQLGSAQRASTARLNARWQPLPQLMLRGSVGSGFRSASLLDLAEPSTPFGVTAGYHACPFDSGYDPRGWLAAGVECPDGTQWAVQRQGHAGLRPERSTQASLGLVLQPLPTLSATLDWWQVQVRDAVLLPAEESVLAEPDQYLDFYTPVYNAQTGRTELALNLHPVNVGKSESAGLDYDLHWRPRLPAGAWPGGWRPGLRLSGTHMLRSRSTDTGRSRDWVDALDRYGDDGAVVFRNLLQLTLSLERADWQHSLRAHYRSGYRDVDLVNDGMQSVAVQRRVASTTTLDWMSRWRVSRAFELQLGVQNLTDRRPPLSLRNTGSKQVGYDPRYASALLRTWSLAASYRF